MSYKWLTFPGIVITVILIWILFENIPSELAPLEDRSRLTFVVSAPEGATFEYMDNYMGNLVDVLRKNIPESEGVFSVTSPGFGASSSVNSGFAGAILVNPDKRERTQQQIADQIMPVVGALSGARTFVTQQQTIGGGRRGGLPVQFVIQAPNFQKI